MIDQVLHHLHSPYSQSLSTLETATDGSDVPEGHAYPDLEPGEEGVAIPLPERCALLQYRVQQLTPVRREGHS